MEKRCAETTEKQKRKKKLQLDHFIMISNQIKTLIKCVKFEWELLKICYNFGARGLCKIIGKRWRLMSVWKRDYESCSSWCWWCYEIFSSYARGIKIMIVLDNFNVMWIFFIWFILNWVYQYLIFLAHFTNFTGDRLVFV